MAVAPHLLEGSDQLLPADRKVLHGPHQAARRCEEEQGWIQAGLACFGDQNYFSPGWDVLLLQHLDGFGFRLKLQTKESPKCVIYVDYLEPAEGVDHGGG